MCELPLNCYILRLISSVGFFCFPIFRRFWLIVQIFVNCWSVISRCWLSADIDLCITVTSRALMRPNQQFLDTLIFEWTFTSYHICSLSACYAVCRYQSSVKKDRNCFQEAYSCAIRSNTWRWFCVVLCTLYCMLCWVEHWTLSLLHICGWIAKSLNEF